jgi:hypothetical protein
LRDTQDVVTGFKPRLEAEKREEMTPAEAQRMTENEIGTRVIEAAIAVHREGNAERRTSQ